MARPTTTDYCLAHQGVKLRERLNRTSHGIFAKYYSDTEVATLLQLESGRNVRLHMALGVAFVTLQRALATWEEYRNAKGDPHKLVITLSSLFTVPLATGVAFNWRELTPVSMLALDQFVLWVNAESPYRAAPDLVAAIRAQPAHAIRLGGTGAKQEDQLLSVLLETLRSIAAGPSRISGPACAPAPGRCGRPRSP